MMEFQMERITALLSLMQIKRIPIVTVLAMLASSSSIPLSRR